MVSAFQGPVLVDLGFLGSQLWSMAIKQTIEAKNAWSWMIDIAMRQPGYGISSSSQIGVDFGGRFHGLSFAIWLWINSPQFQVLGDEDS